MERGRGGRERGREGKRERGREGNVFICSLSPAPSFSIWQPYRERYPSDPSVTTIPRPQYLGGPLYIYKRCGGEREGIRERERESERERERTKEERY